MEAHCSSFSGRLLGLLESDYFLGAWKPGGCGCLSIVCLVCLDQKRVFSMKDPHPHHDLDPKEGPIDRPVLIPHVLYLWIWRIARLDELQHSLIGIAPPSRASRRPRDAPFSHPPCDVPNAATSDSALAVEQRRYPVGVSDLLLQSIFLLSMETASPGARACSTRHIAAPPRGAASSFHQST
jgi:hypothetical protein